MKYFKLICNISCHVKDSTSHFISRNSALNLCRLLCFYSLLQVFLSLLLSSYFCIKYFLYCISLPPWGLPLCHLSIYFFSTLIKHCNRFLTFIFLPLPPPLSQFLTAFRIGSCRGQCVCSSFSGTCKNYENGTAIYLQTDTGGGGGWGVGSDSEYVDYRGVTLSFTG